MMKKLLIALLLLTSPAYAQKTKTALTTEINTNLASGTAITASTLRTTLLDVINSYYDLNGGTSLSCAAHQLVSALPTLSSITCTQLPSPGAVSVLDYGAIAGDNTKYVVNQTAFQNAFATGNPVYCPAGQTFYTQSITIPTNAPALFGKCTLIAAGSYSGANAVLSLTAGNSGFVFSDFVIANDLTLYPSIDGIDILTGNINTRVNGVTANGFDPIFDLGSGTTISKVIVTDFTNIGIFSSTPLNTRIIDSSVTNLHASSVYCIAAGFGSGITITGNFAQECKSFGIVVAGLATTPFTASNDIVISDNRTLNTTLEGINVTGGTDFTITGNVAQWTNNSSTDFGISVYGAPANAPGGDVLRGTISGNTVTNACKSGISLDNITNDVSVTGNTIYNANACNIQSPTTGYQYAIQGILMYGGAQHNSVAGNNIIDPNGYLTWGVAEYDDGSGTLPDFNSVIGNTGVGTSGAVKLIGAHSTMGEPCVFQQGASTCNGNPTTQPVTFAQITAANSQNSLLFSSTVNTNAGSSAGAVNIATSNAGSIYMQANSTAGGASTVISTTNNLPMTVGSSGSTTNLGTAGTLPVDSTGLLKAATGKLAINGGTATAGLATVTSGGVLSSEAQGTGVAAALATNVGTAGSFLTTSRHVIPFGSQTGVGGAGATSFFLIGASATELNIYGVSPVSGTFKNLYVNLNTAPGGSQTDTFTLRVNGSDTAVTCTATGSATACVPDTTHTAAIAAGQTFSIKIVGSASANATIANGGIELDTQ